MQTSLLQKILILRLCPDLPIQQKPGYTEFCEICIFHVVQLCCKRTFKNNKLIKMEYNVMQKEIGVRFFNDRNFY